VKKVGVLVFKKERLNSRQPNYDGRAYDGALVYSGNLGPNESLDGCRLRVQLLGSVQLLGHTRCIAARPPVRRFRQPKQPDGLSWQPKQPKYSPTGGLAIRNTAEG
jgi:hypothetical protein